MSYHTRFSDRVVLRDGCSGHTLLCCYPADLRRRRWNVCASNNERVVRVQFVRKKAYGERARTHGAPAGLAGGSGVRLALAGGPPCGL